MLKWSVEQCIFPTLVSIGFNKLDAKHMTPPPFFFDLSDQNNVHPGREI